jgi:uncharacterized protein (DUF4213/DUF364 family)
MLPAKEIYDLMIDRVRQMDEQRIEEIVIGLTWTLCRTSGDNIGLNMSPGIATRTLPWSGTLVGKNASEVVEWIRSWDPYQSGIAMAAINAIIGRNSELLANAKPIDMSTAPGNLTVFEHFAPMMKNKKVAVIGRYPGFDLYEDMCDLTVIERNPGRDDLPDQACEYVLPESEWVFITGSSIPNKTFPRLLELSRHANVVLLGPTAPWLPELGEMGVDYVAGVKVDDAQKLRSTVAEGGGIRIFGNGVSYFVADVSQGKLDSIKKQIAEVVTKRDHLKSELEAWQSGVSMSPLPRVRELETLDRQLSELDSQYKRLWDSRNPMPAFIKQSANL